MNLKTSYFIHLHDIGCNQTYGDWLPYSFHLKAVAAQAKKFDMLLMLGMEYDESDVVEAACYAHDSLEDARLSYNDLLGVWENKQFAREVADIVYCLTDEKGKNRKERKNDKYYEELAKNELAVFVKLADIAANTLYSKLTGSDMYERYKKEFPRFKKKVYKEKYKAFFQYVESL